MVHQCYCGGCTRDVVSVKKSIMLKVNVQIYTRMYVMTYVFIFSMYTHTLVCTYVIQVKL